MTRRVATGIVRISARLAPRRLRPAWREEWLAEIAAASGARGRLRVFARALGAPIDAALLRWTAASPDLSVRNGLTADFRDARRALAKTPLQTAAMIGCLAVGAALMVSVFAIANTLSTADPAGVRDRERLVRIGARVTTSRHFLYTLLMSDYRRADWQRPPDAFDAIAGEYGTGFVPVAIEGGVHEVRGLRVTGTYFPVFRSVPAIGRLIGPSDDVPGAAPVVVLGHGFWQRHFGADPGVVGRTLRIGTGIYEIVGVAPPGFVGFEMGDLGQSADADRDFWIPMAPALAARPGDSAAPDLLGRLAAGVTLQQAEAQLQAFLPDPLMARSRKGWLGALPYRLAPLYTTRDFALFFALLFSVPVVVLLIACANVAGLQAVRAVQRRHELALRTSLGATRGRLARLLVIETLIVAAAAAAAGWGATVVVLRQSAAFLPFAAEPDWRVFLFALGLPLAVTLVIGVIPSWRSTRFDVLSGLRLGARAGGAGRTRVRRALIAAQVALSIALVFTAIILSRAVATGPAGMIPAAPDIATAGFYLTGRVSDESAQRAAVQHLIEEASQLAGPGDVAFSTGPLLVSGRASMAPPGAKPRFDDWFDQRLATPAFFELLGVTLLEGRFSRAREQGVMVVNETFARRFSDGGPIVGKSFAFADGGLFSDPSTSGVVSSRQVIGLVKDGFERDGNDRQAALAYLPLDTSRLTSVAVFVRSSNSAETLQRLRAMAARVSPTLMPRPFGTVESLMSEEYRSAIWLSRGLGSTGTLALLLAAVGLFSLVSASVTQRTHELGVRVALGARGADIIGLIVRDIALMSGVGVVAGIALAVPAWLFIQDEVMNNATLLDPFGLFVGLAALGVTMFAATYAPARRACRADPLNALRSE